MPFQKTKKSFNHVGHMTNRMQINCSRDSMQDTQEGWLCAYVFNVEQIAQCNYIQKINRQSSVKALLKL